LKVRRFNLIEHIIMLSDEGSTAPADSLENKTTEPEAPAVEVSESVEESSEEVKTVAPESASTAEADEEEDSKIVEIIDRPGMKWYIVNTASGFEAKAKKSLFDNVKRNKKEEDFGDVLIPVESVVELVKGKKRSTERKFYPGYILVQMKLDDVNWHIVKDSNRISGFVGNKKNPPALRKSEVLRIAGQMTEGLTKARPKYNFREGDNIRVIDGPFSNFNGTVEEVKPEKSKLRVLVSIFGRATPVELDFIQVEKT